MIENLLLMFPFLLTNSDSAVVKDLNPSHFSNSETFIEEPVIEDEPEEPYIIYDNDESSSLSNAENISLNVQYSRMYNNRYDYDYFTISNISLGTFIKFENNRSSYITIYKSISSNSASVYTYSRIVNSSEVFWLDEAASYTFVFCPSNLYTGPYQFKISSLSISQSDYDNYFVHLGYTYNNSYIDHLPLINKDYSSKPSTNSRLGRRTQRNNVASNFEYSSSDKLSTSLKNLYFNIDVANTGIFNVYGENSNDFNDDDRNILNYLAYPGDSVCCTQVTDSFNQTHKCSSYYVSDNYLMSASHILFNPSTNTYGNTNNITIYQERHSEEYNGSYFISDSYAPLNYFYGRLNNIEYKQYDWCILKRGLQLSPESYNNYVHGYLGLKYTNNSYVCTRGLGYPLHYCLRVGSQVFYITEIKDEAVSYCVLESYGNLYRTKNDLTGGMSGGPCAEIDLSTGSAYAVGTISGNELFSGSCYNVCSKINKSNYNLLVDLENGEI